MAGPRVPSIPVSALDAIQDRNVYAVLRAIADQLNVRNGDTGDSDSAFITRAELGKLRGGNIITVAGGQQQSQYNLPQIIRPADIARVINDLQAQVIESPLFKALGERINKIDAPGTGVIAQLDDERTIRSTAVSALVEDITTLTAGVDGNTAAIATEASVRATADGLLNAQYTVKVDVNGYVSGFGLASTAVNATPYSDFTVRADRFSIASPSGPGITPKVPFIVLTTPTTVNGYTVPAGVYIDAAMIKVASIGEAQIDFAAIREAHLQNAIIGTAKIKDAAITSAKIGSAEVDTLNIRGDAVTVPRGAYTAGPIGVIPGVGATIISVAAPSGAPAVAIIGSIQALIAGSTCTVFLQRDGSTVYQIDIASTGSGVAGSLTYFDTSGAGGTYRLVHSDGTSVTSTIYNVSLIAIGCKR